jgi:hypothetical protein
MIGLEIKYMAKSLQTLALAGFAAALIGFASIAA